MKYPDKDMAALHLYPVNKALRCFFRGTPLTHPWGLDGGRPGRQHPRKKHRSAWVNKFRMGEIKKAALLLPLILFPTWAPALSLEEYPLAETFLADISGKHGFPREQLKQILLDAKIKESILKAISRPAEAKPWHEYRNIFLTEKRIRHGVDFWRQHQALLDKAEQSYGVPPHIITAILGVETFYGTRTGSFRVLDALSTLAFAYPRRAVFFGKELEHFLLLSREENLDPRQPQGSYAGAMGWPQFMPSSYRQYAADFDGDGKRDIWSNPGDVIASVANYFVSHGWRPNQPVAVKLSKPAPDMASNTLKAPFTLAYLKAKGISIQKSYPPKLKANVLKLAGENGDEYWLGFTNFYVITRYNHSPLYAMAVHQLSQAIRERFLREAGNAY